MSVGTKLFRGLPTFPAVATGAAVLAAATGIAFAEPSEIDGYDRAVTVQTKESALTFLREFPSSHLVGDLIESLRPEVAREVCADLPGAISRARRACERLRQMPVADGAVTAGTMVAPSASAPAAQPPATANSSVLGRSTNAPDMSMSATGQSTHAGLGSTVASTQPLLMQPAVTNTPTPATIEGAVAPQAFEPAAGGQAASSGVLAAKAVTATQTAVAVPSFRIQFLSAKSRAETESAWQELQMAYPDLLRDLEFRISEVDLGAAQGMAYRGVAGPLPSRDEAVVLCIVIRSSPPYNDCVVAQY